MFFEGYYKAQISETTPFILIAKTVCRVKQQTLHSLDQIKTQKHCFELVHNVPRGLCVQTNSASCQPGNSSGTQKTPCACEFINQIDAKANKPHAAC
jgi:hypothetical protein